MSSPVARRSHSPSSSSSSSGSSSGRGIYVPLHKRSAPSSATSVESSSSRPCSPSHHKQESPVIDAPQPRIYTTGYLLSLRPFATEGLKAKMRETCPEVVMNRRMRKSIEFNEHQARAASKREHQQQHQQQHHYQQHHASPTLSPSLNRTRVSEELNLGAPHPVAVAPTHVSITPRRARPTGRAPERRRQVLHEAWHGPSPTPLVSV
ncbi:hypothetical protein BDN70DRAFT_931583 [Pholiota conissans]|uniref:Uncharacterized protein n=1 Tax=Pholiota conissans TaxID=109636 RepID=A0A9P5Z3P8_9AGAR|nr:hypothetical protein BDN70DRAFT_931583 [Pholiota conissans]